jgi:hypothetical protein
VADVSQRVEEAAIRVVDEQQRFSRAHLRVDPDARFGLFRLLPDARCDLANFGRRPINLP